MFFTDLPALQKHLATQAKAADWSSGTAVWPWDDILFSKPTNTAAVCIDGDHQARLLPFTEAPAKLQQHILSQWVTTLPTSRLHCLAQAISRSVSIVHIPKHSHNQLTLALDTLGLPVVIVLAEAGSHTTITETVAEQTHSGGRSVIVLAEADATITYHTAAQSGLQQYYAGVAMGERSTINWQVLQQPTHQTDCQITNYTPAAGSRVVIGSLLQTAPDSRSRYELRNIHSNKNSFGRIASYTVAVPNSDIRLPAYIGISANAPQTDSQLTQKSLLMDDTALVHTSPDLEIKNRFVTASHAATIHSFRPDELLYLRNRGLTTDDARQLLLQGFFQQALSHLPNPTHATRASFFASI